MPDSRTIVMNETNSLSSQNSEFSWFHRVINNRLSSPNAIAVRPREQDDHLWVGEIGKDFKEELTLGNHPASCAILIIYPKRSFWCLVYKTSAQQYYLMRLSEVKWFNAAEHLT